MFTHNPPQVFVCWFDATHRFVGDLNFRSVDSGIGILLGGTEQILNPSSGSEI